MSFHNCKKRGVVRLILLLNWTILCCAAAVEFVQYTALVFNVVSTCCYGYMKLEQLNASVSRAIAIDCTCVGRQLFTVNTRMKPK